MSDFKLESPSFRDGAMIPVENTREGSDLSPALRWSGVPPSTEELALLCEDPDAPQEEPWVHWILCKIPPSLTELPEGVRLESRQEMLGGCVQGTNSYGDIGYGGPLPPVGHGPHRYYFKLFALDEKIDVKNGITKNEFLDAIRTHVLGETELLGKYEAKKRTRKSA